MNPTRRTLLMMAGAMGGSAAVFHAARAMDLIGTPEARNAGPVIPRLESDAAKPHVIILGAGIGGLAAAYELQKAGYRYTILEASHRTGGRCFTARHGTVIDELGNRQVCQFDDDPDLYCNMGPARIPGMHHRLLGYCKELGVRLEPFVNTNYNAWVQEFGVNGGKRVRQREFIADARGFLAEMAAKNMPAEELDKPVGPLEFQKLGYYLQEYGDLSDDLIYRGTGRAGHLTGGILNKGEVPKPREMKEMLSSVFGYFWMSFAENEYQSPSLMQPVGGMERIADAFVAALQVKPKLNCVVSKIRQSPDNVTVTFQDKGQTRQVVGDYCLNSIPGHLMAGIDHDFSDAYAACVGQIQRSSLSKIGLQMKSRFWEEEGIYGGISWSTDDLLQLWYPSHGHHSQKGVVLGGYIFFPHANDAFARMSHDQRMEAAVTMGEKLHPGQYRRNVETGVSVAWQRMNHMLGCGHGVSGGGPGERNPGDYMTIKRLCEGDGRHFMIGDQVTLHPGWQEAALAASENALGRIHEHLKQASVDEAR